MMCSTLSRSEQSLYVVHQRVGQPGLMKFSEILKRHRLSGFVILLKIISGRSDDAIPTGSGSDNDTASLNRPRRNFHQDKIHEPFHCRFLAVMLARWRQGGELRMKINDRRA
jgi:hypothetical protein